MNVFKLIPASFHSVAAYRHMRQTANFGMGYALLMVAITTLAVVIYGANLFHQAILDSRDASSTSALEAMALQVADQVPTMTFDKGVLVTQKPEIYTISIGDPLKKSSESEEVITIDTTGKTTIDNMQTPILITSKDVIIDNDRKKEVHSLSEFAKDQHGPMIINKSVAEDAARTLIAWLKDNALTLYLIFGGVMWCFAIIFFFILRMIMLFLLGLVGIAYAAIRNIELSYASAVALASLSYTPVLLLDTLLFMVDGKSPMALTLFFAGCVTLIFAIHVSNPAKPPQMVG